MIDPLIQKMLDRAKIQLMMLPETMFYTTILFSLRSIWDDQIPTAGVDGSALWINPAFFQKQTEKSRIGLLVHEVLHVALNHITRRGTRDHLLFNMAGDYVINNMLDHKGYELPHGALIDHKYDGMNTEQVYKILLEEAEKNPKKYIVIPGIGGDVMYPKTAAENSAVEQGIADIVMRAAVQAKSANNGAGAIPGEILIEIDRLTNPKLPWNIIFQNYMQSFAKDEYSWRRPNKRFMPDYYLPTAFGESLCNIVAAVDCSGSVSDTDFSHFISELDTIQEIMHPEKITVIDFDTKIGMVQEISENAPIQDLKFHGRGGTEIQPVLAWAKENTPAIMIVFTDGEFFHNPTKEEDPEVPVIWLVHNNPSFTCQFGEVIHYEL